MSSFPIMTCFLCSALMPARICWLSSAPNWVAHFHANLDDLIIISNSKSVSIPASFIQLGFLGGILVLLFFIATVTIRHFLHIPPGEVLATISFLVGICALLGDVGVSFRTYLLHLSWVEESFELLEVHSIGERSIGAPVNSASTPNKPTTASPYAATALSKEFKCWYTYTVAPTSLVFFDLRNSEGFGELGCHIGYIAKPITKLVVLDFGIGQRDGQVILNSNTINQSLHHCLLYDLVMILRDFQKWCLQACSIFCKR